MSSFYTKNIDSSSDNLVENLFYLTKWGLQWSLHKIGVLYQEQQIINARKRKEEELQKQRNKEYWKFVRSVFFEWLQNKFSTNIAQSSVSVKEEKVPSPDIVKANNFQPNFITEKKKKSSLSVSFSDVYSAMIKDSVTKKINSALTKEQLLSLFDSLYEFKYVKKVSESKLLGHFLLDSEYKNGNQITDIYNKNKSRKIIWNKNMTDFQFFIKRLVLSGLLEYLHCPIHLTNLHHFKISENTNLHSMREIYSRLPKELEEIPKNQLKLAELIDNSLKIQN